MPTHNPQADVAIYNEHTTASTQQECDGKVALCFLSPSIDYLLCVMSWRRPTRENETAGN